MCGKIGILRVLKCGPQFLLKHTTAASYMIIIVIENIVFFSLYMAVNCNVHPSDALYTKQTI